jgi:hypothetical protein
MELPEHALLAVQLISQSVSNEDHFTLEAQKQFFVHISHTIPVRSLSIAI